MKLNAHYITESHDQLCVICKLNKAGKFLIIDLPNKKYIGICNKCLKG